MPAEPTGDNKQQGEALHPLEDRGTVDLDTAYEEEFRDHDHLRREHEAGERKFFF